MTKIVNKYILITLALLFSASVFSQQHKNEFYISGSAGASKLMTKLNTGKSSLELGGAFGLGYKRFFNENIGLSIGLEGAKYNGGFKATDLIYRERVKDNSFGNVDYSAVLSNYREKHGLFSVNVPILLHFQTSGKHKFYAAVGGKVCLPVSLKSKQMPISKIHATGYAPLYNTHFDDLEIKGYGVFEKNEEVKRSTSDLGLKTKVGAVLTGELGMKWKLGEKCSLYTAAFVDYGITSVSSIAEEGKDKHFLPYYGMSALTSKNDNAPVIVNSVLNSRYDYKDDKGVNFSSNDKMSPFMVGVKLAISFGFGGQYGDSKAKSSDIVKVVAPVVVPIPAPKPEPVEVPETKVELVEEPVLKPIVEPILERVIETVEKQRPEKEIQEEPVVIKEKEKVTEYSKDATVLIDNYKINTYNVTSAWTSNIDELLLRFKEDENLRIVLEGHTCNLGSDKVNDRISLQRAEDVKKYLVEKGFAPERIQTVGKGKHSPIVPNTSLKNRLKNRRVVFIMEDSRK